MTESNASPRDQKGIWDYFQTEGHDRFAGSRGRLAWLAKRLRPGSKVLDIGIGSGTFAELAAARGADVHCLDPSQAAIDALRDRLKLGEKAKAGGIDAIPWPDRTFDTVVASEVLEHLPDDVLQAGLGEVARVLVPGGRLLGTVPWREDLRESMVVCPCCGARFHRWGHQRSFDEESMRAQIEPHLAVERMFARPFVTWEELDWQGALHAAARHAFRALGIHGRNECLVFLASRTRP